MCSPRLELVITAKYIDRSCEHRIPVCQICAPTPHGVFAAYYNIDQEPIGQKKYTNFGQLIFR